MSECGDLGANRLGHEIVFLHFMGAKPWMESLEARRGADWEPERPSYHALEAVWWKVRRGEIGPGAGAGAVLAALPLDKVVLAAELGNEKRREALATA